jgi:uncharacterized protein YqeY
MTTTELKKTKLVELKSGNKLHVTALDSVIGSIQLDEARGNKVDVITKIQKSVDELNESLTHFKTANENTDKYDFQIEELKTKIQFLQTFLPTKLTTEETIDAISRVIAEVGASGMQDMGKVMGALKKEFGTTIDMSFVSQKVKELL